MREVLIGFLFPTRAPDQLEVSGEGTQVVAGGGRKVVVDAVDVLEGPGWTPVQVESKQGDHPVHVDEQHRKAAVCGEFHVTTVTRPCNREAARVSKLPYVIKADGGGADRGTKRRRVALAARNLKQ